MRSQQLWDRLYAAELQHREDNDTGALAQALKTFYADYMAAGFSKIQPLARHAAAVYNSLLHNIEGHLGNDTPPRIEGITPFTAVIEGRLYRLGWAGGRI